MNLTVIKQEGAVYSLADYDIKTLDFEVDALVSDVTSEVIAGRHGHVDVGAQYNVRSLRGRFFMKAQNYADYALLRSEILRIFASKDQFYVIDDREPGRRWKVRVSGGFTVKQVAANKGFFDIEFIAATPFAESIGTTADPLTFDAELWQLGQGLNAEDLAYVHSTPTFSVYNAGDVAIDPRELPLKITFTGASTDLRIKNVTTGDDWQFIGTTNASQNIVLDGVRATRSGLSVFGATNRKLITIAPGWNDFEITGATGAFTIAFDFRFYYA